MTLDTLNLRGETVAIAAKKIRIKMVAAVKGEDGRTLSTGSTPTVSEPFALELMRRGVAEPAAEAKAEPKGKGGK